MSSLAEQLAWLADRLADLPTRADQLAAETTTDPTTRRQIAADILRGRVEDYASDLRALANEKQQGDQPVTDHDPIRRLVELSISIEAVYYDSTGEVATYLRQAGDKVLIALGKASTDRQQQAVVS